MSPADTTDSVADDPSATGDGAADPAVADAAAESSAVASSDDTSAEEGVRWWRIAGAVRDDVRLAHAEFARATAGRLRRTLRAEVELSLTAAEWVTGGEWLASAAEPVALAWIELPGVASGMLMRLDATFGLFALDRLLGGMGARPVDRELTELDLTLLHEVFAAAVSSVDVVFGSELTAPPRLALVVTRPKLLRLAAPTEPMMLLTYRVDTDVESAPPGTLCLGYPEDVVTKVLDQIDAKPVTNERPSEGDPALQWLMGDVEITVSARLRPSHFSVEDLRGLRVGDVMSLDHRRDEPIELAVGGLGLLDGALGRHGGNVAVRVHRWRSGVRASEESTS